MTVGLVLDGAMALLLVATIGFCIVLYLRLERFRTASAEMKSAIAGFSSATLRAEASTAGLRKAAGDLGERLQSQIESGRALADELQFILATAAESANSKTIARDDQYLQTDFSAAGDPQDDMNSPVEQSARTEAERELLEAMRQAR